jgi:MFS family permease
MAITVGTLLVTVEWQTAFWSIGFIGGAIMFVLIFLFKSRPSDIGVRAYGAPEDEPIQEITDPNIARIRAKTFRKCMQSTTDFWKLVVVHHLGCVGHAIVIIYVIPIAVASGLDLVTAAGVLSTLAGVSVLTRFTTPVIADYLGAKWSMAIMFMLQGFPVLMLFWTQDAWQFYLFAVVFGVGYGGEGSAFPIINRQYFGRGPMGRSFGWQQFGAGSGMATGGWIGGAFYALFGSYDAAILLSTIASIGGALVLVSMAPTTKLLIPNWEDALPPEARTASPALSGD